MKLAVAKKNTKLGKVWNLSLTPIVSCPEGVPCAKDCYALKAYRMYKQTKVAWDTNYDLWKADPIEFYRQLIEVFMKARKLPDLFRWHVSGDIPDRKYLDMMVSFATNFPEVKFLAFTKRYDLMKGYRQNSELPANLTIVLSAWPDYPIDNPVGHPVAWMDNGNEPRIPADAIQCSGTCDKCTKCWGLTGNVVFKKH